MEVVTQSLARARSLQRDHVIRVAARRVAGRNVKPEC
jgi:hypothetical protein